MSDELRLSIEKLVYGGDGLGHANGNTVFVPFVLPGEDVRAAEKSKKKKVVWAKLVEVTSASKERIAAPCPHFQTCGGCHYQHITADEQLRRFRDRLIKPLKRWKLTYEDFRNRARWSDYETAIEDMMAQTSTKDAPWHLIPANDKPYGRIAALRILVDRLGNGVALEPRPIDPKLLKEAKRARTSPRATSSAAAGPASAR